MPWQRARITCIFRLSCSSWRIDKDAETPSRYKSSHPHYPLLHYLYIGKHFFPNLKCVVTSKLLILNLTLNFWTLCRPPMKTRYIPAILLINTEKIIFVDFLKSKKIRDFAKYVFDKIENQLFLWHVEGGGAKRFIQTSCIKSVHKLCFIDVLTDSRPNMSHIFMFVVNTPFSKSYTEFTNQMHKRFLIKIKKKTVYISKIMSKTTPS